MDQPTISQPPMIEEHSNGTASAIRAAIEAVESAPVAPKTLPRRRAINLTLSNGFSLQVREPGYAEMPVYFRSIGALQKLAEIFQAASLPVLDKNGNETEDTTLDFNLVQPIPPDITDALMPLLLLMCDLTEEDFMMLPIEDSLIVSFAIYQFMPKN